MKVRIKTQCNLLRTFPELWPCHMVPISTSLHKLLFPGIHQQLQQLYIFWWPLLASHESKLPLFLMMSAKPQPHGRRLVYISNFGCQHEVEPWTPLDYRFHAIIPKKKFIIDSAALMLPLPNHTGLCSYRWLTATNFNLKLEVPL